MDVASRTLERRRRMTNRDAINLLEEVKILDDTMYAYNPKYLDALDMALTALEAEETWFATHEYPQKQQWIPCSERLPDTTDFVLTINIVSQCGVYRFDGDCWLDYDGLFVNEGIRAWMPLPEPI